VRPGGDYTLTITRQQLLDALADAGLIILGAGTGGAVWDDLASAAVSAPVAAPDPAPDLTPADDELSRQQAAEALTEWHAAMTDEGSLGDMLSAGQQMAEFIADWLDASRMPEGVDNPGYFGLGGPTA
jgi:hypothetical protein